jgi:hypothetical protein
VSFTNIKEHRQSLKSTLWCIPHWWVRTLVYSWSGNCLGCWGVVFTDFKEHTTIYRVYHSKNWL